MRKVVTLVVVVVAVFFVVRSGILTKSSPSPAPTPPTSTKITPPDATPKGPEQPAKASGVPRPTDPAVAAVMDEMLSAWDTVPQLFVAMDVLLQNAAGHRGKTIGKGKYWLQKKNGKDLIHFELRNELRIKQEDENILVTGEILITTIDGEFMYKFINQPGHKEATKNKLDYSEVLHIGGPNLWRDLVTNNTLTLLPEEMKFNRALKVIKAKPNDGSPETINYFDKANGLRLELVELDGQGQTGLHITLTDIQLNPTIGEEQFKPVIPEGVTLEDRSNTP